MSHSIWILQDKVTPKLEEIGGQHMANTSPEHRGYRQEWAWRIRRGRAPNMD